ncbi:MAG: PilZ domain-containing protein, partial [Pseudomonadota bacterium]
VRVSPALGSRFHSFTVDISKTGAFIETQSDHLDVGDEVDLRFSAESVKPLQIKAQVVRKGANQRQRRHEFGYGVRFEDLDQSQKKVLDRFLSTH